MGVIYIRADANTVISSGHIMRCRTIADELQNLNCNVIFILSNIDSKVILGDDYDSFILNSIWNDWSWENEKDKWFGLFSIDGCSSSSRAVVIDSYYVTNEYLSFLRNFSKVILIDNLLENRYDVDMVIGYSIYHTQKEYESMYEGSKTNLVIGTNYVPLRSQFSNCSTIKIAESNAPKKVLLMSGGGDSFNILPSIVNRLLNSNEFNDFKISVVVGIFCKNYALLKSLENAHPNLKIYPNVTMMADLMSEHDFLISAAGTTLFEACAIGIPTLFYIMADNQQRSAISFVENDLMIYLGDIRVNKEAVLNKLSVELNSLNSSVERRKIMQIKMRELVDGMGAERIAHKICNLINKN